MGGGKCGSPTYFEIHILKYFEPRKCFIFRHILRYFEPCLTLRNEKKERKKVRKRGEVIGRKKRELHFLDIRKRKEKKRKEKNRIEGEKEGEAQ